MDRATVDGLSAHSEWVMCATDLKGFLVELERVKPSILHLVGHGDRLDRFAFETETGCREFVQPEKLASCLHSYTPTLECVVISACYSKKLAEEITKETPYAIAYEEALEIEVAKEYSYWFYFYLTSGNSYEIACSRTAKALETKIPKNKIPKLFVKGQSGVSEPIQVEETQPIAVVQTEKPVEIREDKQDPQPSVVEKTIQEEKKEPQPNSKPTPNSMTLEHILSLVEKEQMQKVFAILDSYEANFSDKFTYSSLKKDYKNDKFGMLEANIRSRLAVFLSDEKDAIAKW